MQVGSPLLEAFWPLMRTGDVSAIQAKYGARPSADQAGLWYEPHPGAEARLFLAFPGAEEVV